MAIGYFDKNSIESALKVGIDTGTPIFRDGNIEGIKPLSSGEIEAIRSELSQCDENSKTIIFDTASEIMK